MKAIALVSGGLDSILAARMIKEQNIEVIPLNFKIPFCHRKKNDKSPDKFSLVRDGLGVELKIIDIGDDFLKLIENPRHGFGSNLNPCIDCKILMLKKAGDLLKEWGADFIVTGEVLGQRPMSQHKQALGIVAKSSGMEGLILRPLSAKLLPVTIPEEKGWLSRDKLLNFNGRTRKPQMNLAKAFNIENYPNAAGGCLLTDPRFSQRLKDLLKYKQLNIEEVELLKTGRHFRLSETAKLIVGRNEKENAELVNLARAGDFVFHPSEKTAGPTGIGRGEFDFELIRLGCSIICRYSDLTGKDREDIFYQDFPDKEEHALNVTAIKEEELSVLRL